MHSTAPPVYPELAAELARQGINAADLGRRIGRSSQTISQIVRGRLRPSDELRNRIADQLGRPADELFRLHPDIERLVDLAVQQGFGRVVDDPVTISKLATLTR
jgi:transcriptional regulator with XRE-family HTH domain